MRILIDTNIFIYREADQVLSENQQILNKTLHEIGAIQIIHPSSVKEIEKNPDPGKKMIMLSKIRAYPQLESPPDPLQDSGFCAQIAPKPGTNDEIDNALLYCVCRDAVDYLITEDRKIIAKALWNYCQDTNQAVYIDNILYSTIDYRTQFFSNRLKETGIGKNSFNR